MNAYYSFIWWNTRANYHFNDISKANYLLTFEGGCSVDPQDAYKRWILI